MKRLSIIILFLLVSHFVQSKEITVSLFTKSQQKIANVVVYFTPQQKQNLALTQEIAIMDQVDTQFSPHILAIQKGTKVRFPNSDSIKHHVYSFSPAKTFELQLYKELQADPLLFSKLGSVELGCNIHDWMLGYIFVVDTPYFGKTDINGNLTLDLPNGEYQLNVWHPRIQDDSHSLSKQLTMPRESKIEIILESPLLPDLNQYENTSDEFSDYE